MEFTIIRKSKFVGCLAKINVSTPVGTFSIENRETKKVVCDGEKAEIFVEKYGLFGGVTQTRYIVNDKQTVELEFTASINGILVSIY